MSLIIKGSIMPLMCEECPCYDCDDYSCKATGRGVIEYRYHGRPDNCPLVEVPTPHGDLVDRDDLIDEINRVTFAERYDYNVAYNIVTDAETIIEAEVSE